MHAMRREGGKLCMSDHWHYGSSSGSHATKAAAQRAAIASWQDFTDLEYGRSMGAVQPRGVKEDRLLAQRLGLELRRRGAPLQVV